MWWQRMCPDYSALTSAACDCSSWVCGVERLSNLARLSAPEKLYLMHSLTQLLHKMNQLHVSYLHHEKHTDICSCGYKYKEKWIAYDKVKKCAVDDVRAVFIPTTNCNCDNSMFLTQHLWGAGAGAFRSARQFNAIRVGQDTGRKI